jgi:acyl-homoserine-lactone acylase
MSRHAIAALLLFACSLARAGDPPRLFQQLQPGQVALYRDDWGMPHVYAPTEADGYFGLGYATAEDRLVQVLFLYLRMRGELAKQFGSAPIRTLPGVYQLEFEPPGGSSAIASNPPNSDRNALRGRFLLDARANFAKLPPQLQRNMRSYIAGMQRYMDAHPRAVPAWAPKLEPALPLALFAALSFPIDAENSRAPCAAALLESSRTASISSDLQLILGSNAWALGGSRVADAAAVFGADPHSGLIQAGGPTFYKWRLHTPRLDVYGVDVSGTASMMFGHSRHFAWGWTEGPRAVADCYAVETLESQPRRYRYEAEQRSMEVVPYRIEVKGEKTITGEFEYTNHNGVRSLVTQRVGRIAYVVSNASMARAGHVHEQMYKLATAGDRAALRAALEQRDWYGANLIIAGADGTLLYTRPGRIPRRAPGVNTASVLDGNTSRTAWLGIHSFADAVQVWNPVQGFVANTNVSPDMLYREPLVSADKFPDYFMFQPGRTGPRQRRLIDVFERAERFSAADAEALIFDVQMPGTEKWGPAIAAALAAAGDSPDTASDPKRQNFLRELTRFDGRFAAESSGALFHHWMRVRLYREDAETVDAMSDAIDTGNTLTGAQQKKLLQVVDDTYVNLQSRTGCDYLNKTFGDVYRIGRGPQDYPSSGINFNTRKVPPRAGAPLLAMNYGLMGGGCQHRAYTGPHAAFTVLLGPKVRSFSVSVWGASEDPKSPHYNDQSRLASERRLRSNWFEPQELAAHIASSRLLSTRPAKRR